MKKLFIAALLALASPAFAATTVPVQLLTPAGSTSGQAVVSTGPTTAPAWGNVTATALAAQATNTVVANITASSASPTAVAIPTCNTSTSALQYTPVTGFTCYASSATTTGTLAQFATGGAINPASTGATTPGTGAFTTLAASGAITGTGFNNLFASPPNIGTVAPAIGSFTSLSASGNDALFYSNTSAQSIPNNSATTVTTWTKVSDRVNANFNASTGTFTAPATGYYQVSAQLTYAPAAGLVNANYVAQIFANGVVVANGSFFQESTSTVNVSVAVSAIVSLTAGQTISLKAFQNSGSSLALTATATQNYLSINRLP